MASSFAISSGVLACAVALRIGNHVELFDVLAVGVHLQAGQNLAAFVVVAVAEFVAGGDRLHADFGEQLLIVVRTRAAHEQHRRLALAARLHHHARRLHLGHLFGDHLFHARLQPVVFKVLGNPAQRLGRRLGADEVHLHPRNAEALFHHLGHVVDRAVAHDQVQVGRVRVRHACHRSSCR